MKKIIFPVFRTLVRTLHGSGLRRIHFINRTYLAITRAIRPPAVNFRGFKMFLDPEDCLGASFHDEYEEPEIQLVKKYIKPNDNVLDMGAHIGYFTLNFARQTCPNGRVFAFEPSLVNYSLLAKNIKANNFENAVAVNAAVSDKTGKGHLYLSPFVSGDHRTYARPGRKKIDIRTVAIDDFAEKHCNGRIDFVKMDIQGAEIKAMAGMQKTLQKNPGIKMLIEFWPKGLKGHGGDPKEFLENLDAQGFSIYLINGKKHQLEKRTVQEILEFSRAAAPNIFCMRGKELPSVIKI